MPAPRSKRRPRRASPWQGTLRVGLVFVGLIGVNVYFFFLRGGTSLRDLLRASEVKRQVGPPGAIASPPTATPSAAKALPPDVDEDARVIEGVMGEGDTVEKVWCARSSNRRCA